VFLNFNSLEELGITLRHDRVLSFYFIFSNIFAGLIFVLTCFRLLALIYCLLQLLFYVINEWFHNKFLFFSFYIKKNLKIKSRPFKKLKKKKIK
jgi:hypothetical protein